MTALLRLDHVSRSFGGLLAINDVSVSLAAGEVVGLIGPNGAGKTTFVNLVSGTLKPSRGSINFDGRRIDGRRPDLVACAGVARTFQIVQPFPRLTVRENVAAAGLFAGGQPDLAAARAAADTHLAFCGLTQEAEKPASALTLAGRKRLELAKSLATRPKLLLLDEVNAGLNPAEVDIALSLIGAISRRGITVLLIEHVMKVVARACSRVLVLHQGRLIADGLPEVVMQDPAVVEAYLGSRHAQVQFAGRSS